MLSAIVHALINPLAAWCRVRNERTEEETKEESLRRPPQFQTDLFRYSHVHSVKGERSWHADNRCVRRVYCGKARTKRGDNDGDGRHDQLYFASEQDSDDGPDVPDCFRDVDAFKPARFCSDAFAHNCGLLDNDAHDAHDMRFTLVFTCSHDDYAQEYLCNVVLQPHHQQQLCADPTRHLAKHARVQACPTCAHDRCTVGEPPPFDLECDVFVGATWDADAQKWRVSRFSIARERNLWVQTLQQ